MTRLTQAIRTLLRWVGDGRGSERSTGWRRAKPMVRWAKGFCPFDGVRTKVDPARRWRICWRLDSGRLVEAVRSRHTNQFFGAATGPLSAPCGPFTPRLVWLRFETTRGISAASADHAAGTSATSSRPTRRSAGGPRNSEMPGRTDRNDRRCGMNGNGTVRVRWRCAWRAGLSRSMVNKPNGSRNDRPRGPRSQSAVHRVTFGSAGATRTDSDRG